MARLLARAPAVVWLVAWLPSACEAQNATVVCDAYGSCEACAAGWVVDSRGERCLPCAPAAGDFPLPAEDAAFAAGVCSCALENRLLVDSIHGAPLASKVCFPCPGPCATCAADRFSKKSADGLSCECLPGYTFAGGPSCIPSISPASWARDTWEQLSLVPLGSAAGAALVRSPHVLGALRAAAATCFNGDVDAAAGCSLLLNLCVLQHRDEDLSACSVLSSALTLAHYPASQFEPPRAAWLHRPSTWVPELRWENPLPLRVLVRGASGGFVGVRPLTDELLPCGDLPASYLRWALRPGVQGTVDCRFTVASLRAWARRAEADFAFLELYVESVDGSGYQSLQPVPVAIASGGRRCSKKSDRDAMPLSRRFYVVDSTAAAGHLRYLSYVHIGVKVFRNNSIVTPEVCLEYASVALSAADPEEWLATTQLSSQWTGESDDTRKAFAAVFSVVAAGLLGVAGLAYVGERRKKQEAPPAALRLVCPVPEVAAAGVYQLAAESPQGLPSWARADGARIHATPDGRWAVASPSAATPVLLSAPHNSNLPNFCYPWALASGEAAPRTYAVSDAFFISRFVDVESLSAVVSAFCGPMGFVFLFVLWITSAVYYLEFKHSTTRNVTRALPDGLGPFLPGIIAMVVCELLAVSAVVYRVCVQNVVLLDWEVAKGVDKGTKNELEGSVWRSVMVANELYALMKQRTWRSPWCMIWVTWIMLGMGYQSLTTADPTVRSGHRTNYGVPDASFETPDDDVDTTLRQQFQHPVLRFAIAGFYWFLASLVFWGLLKAYHYVLPEDPLDRFVDVAGQCNVSVLLLPQSAWGYYLHGRKQGVQGSNGEVLDGAELSMADWQLQQATPSPAGYLPWKREFEVFFSRKLAADLRSLAAGRAAPPGPRALGGPLPKRSGGATCFELLHPNVFKWAPLPKAADEKIKAVKLAVDEALVRCVQKFPVSLSAVFGVPLPYPLQPYGFMGQGAQGTASGANDVQLYLEPFFNIRGGWAAFCTLLGADSSLHLSEAAVFLAVDALTGSLWWAWFVVLSMYFAGIFAVSHFALYRLSIEAVDPRFLR
ncbi:hypothetical protein DIPPA_18340 [Diplonema papillatum]|nr:hypothetical protein DIPPA_18340 [Diplonema papillatum]